MARSHQERKVPRRRSLAGFAAGCSDRDHTGVERVAQRKVVACDGCHFKCIAACATPGPAANPFLTFGVAYFGLISWQPFSQYTPPAADSGSGIGLATATSRSDSSC